MCRHGRSSFSSEALLLSKAKGKSKKGEVFILSSQNAQKKMVQRK